MKNTENMLGLRMERQHLLTPASEEEYLSLYRDTQPGQNVYYHGFGQPPVLSFRAAFDDIAFNRIRLAERRLAKGRFQGGNVGWIDARDMELLACLFQKPLARPTFIQTQLLDLIMREGPMNIQQMKENTGLLVKEITPALHRLQEAFLIYEDQYDGDWDRGWYRFDEPFPDVQLNRYTREEALRLVLPRFCYRMVWFDVKMAHSFYRLPQKELKAAAEALVQEGVFVEEAGGYLLREDAAPLETRACPPPEQLLVLHRNDILVKTEEHLLKPRYQQPQLDVLQYLLIDGAIHGAVLGGFKHGPYEIAAVSIDAPYEVRRGEILDAIAAENPGSLWKLSHC